MKQNCIILARILLLFLPGCDLSDSGNQNTVPYQSFTLNAAKDTLIVGKQGTRIFIPGRSFVNKDSVFVSEVELQLEEYYERSDMLLRGLTTLSGDKVLETGGMIHISAVSGNQKVFLSGNSYLDIYFKKHDTTRLFLPFQGALTNDRGEITWVVSDSIKLEGTMGFEIIGGYSFVDTLIATLSPAQSFFRSRIMGWINTDIFIKYNGNRAIWVKTQINRKIRLSLALEEINVIIPGKPIGLSFYTFTVPDSLNYIIFAKEIIGNKIYYDLIPKERIRGDTIEVRLKLGSAQRIKDEIDLWMNANEK
ncbi:MAG: hypothetical protein ACK4RF_08695 [Cyclobacteriaceae bacterium]